LVLTLLRGPPGCLDSFSPGDRFGSPFAQGVGVGRARVDRLFLLLGGSVT
jgi:hypothetical protein